jgi:hypothetical protein
MVSALTLSSDAFWTKFQVSDSDIEFITNLLLERERPLTLQEMLEPLIELHIKQLEEKARQAEVPEERVYLPAESFEVGEKLAFPALDNAVGTVSEVRPGENPELGLFKVIAVAFDGDSRSFAAELADHPLNIPEDADEDQGDLDSPQAILEIHGAELEEKLKSRLANSGDIVQIAGRWFPRALLADIHSGHLNLAEAVLDVGGGGPLPTSALLEHIEVPEGIDPLLATFSVDYAMQEDERFDEVGPAGQTLWYLRRLEPPEVLYPPQRLEYTRRGTDRSQLSEDLIELERRLDDELSPLESPDEPIETVTFPVLFPHWRVGALPLTSRLRMLFPTAYEAPRIRFILVDGHGGEKFPGWVVRAERYVFGLDEWYRRYEVPAGGLIKVSAGDTPGEVIVEALERRRRNDWIRTITIDDGHVGFTMLKQPVGTAYDDLMVVGLVDPIALDEAWLQGNQRRMNDEELVAFVFKELAKLNPQSAVHAQSLYSGVNVLRRLPPAPIFSELTHRPYYEHVGDLYWRMKDQIQGGDG